MTPSSTQCIPSQFNFGKLKGRKVIANFEGGKITSDAGIVLIAELDKKLQITSRFAECFQDYRHPSYVDHSVKELVAQRLYGLIQGYEDVNDHEQLRYAPALAIALEKLNSGLKVRYVVTSLPASKYPPSIVYTKKYCPRGEMENRLKEQQLELFSDRTSSQTFDSNQLRLWFSSMAYVLLQAFRQQCLARTSLAKATVGTIRNLLLKLGARITVSVRRILMAISSACPYQDIWAIAYQRIQALPAPG